MQWSGHWSPQPRGRYSAGSRGQIYLHSTPLWLESEKCCFSLSLAGLGFGFWSSEVCASVPFDSCTRVRKWEPSVYFHGPLFDPQGPTTSVATEFGKIWITVQKNLFCSTILFTKPLQNKCLKKSKINQSIHNSSNPWNRTAYFPKDLPWNGMEEWGNLSWKIPKCHCIGDATTLQSKVCVSFRCASVVSILTDWSKTPEISGNFKVLAGSAILTFWITSETEWRFLICTPSLCQ